MSAVSLLKNIYLAYFSRPAADRVLYRAVQRQRPRAIVEIGVGRAVRTQRLLRRILQGVPAADLRYTGIDLFEARPANMPGLSLKQAHTLLKPLGARVQLVPGDPYGALARVANSLRGTDLVIVSHDQDADALARAWFFLPRMLHESSSVYVESVAADGATSFQLVSRAEIQQRAEAQHREMHRAMRRAA